MTDQVTALRARIRSFAEARDWTTFHKPRNLVLALTGEVGEMAAIIQWLTDDEVQDGLARSSDLRHQLSDEMADVLIYLLRLADVCDVDLLAEAFAKIERNESRYPVHLSKGSARKYNELGLTTSD
jgi:NTP pyrophosphatase (non-canonical NTP hydrolase)